MKLKEKIRCFFSWLIWFICLMKYQLICQKCQNRINLYLIIVLSPPITKIIQIRRTRHAGHCWRSRDALISDVLLWTPSHGWAKAGRPARTLIQQLCEDTGCCPDDLPEAMNDRERWRERVRDIRADSMTWWWWWSYLYLQCSTAKSFEIVL